MLCFGVSVLFLWLFVDSYFMRRLDYSNRFLDAGSADALNSNTPIFALAAVLFFLAGSAVAIWSVSRNRRARKYDD
jgi:hypothetical protein